MIEIQNYAPFIQLAVAFDFACVTLNATRERVYGQLDTLFKSISTKADNRITEINDIITKNHEDVTAPALKPISDKLQVSLKKCTSGLSRVKEKKLIYLGPAALVAGMYSIFVLLLLGEIHEYQFLQVIYSLLTEYTFIILIYYLYKENRSKDNALATSTYIYALGGIVFISFLALIGGLWDIHFGSFKMSFLDFYRISLFSLSIPYIPFIVAILWIISCVLKLYFYDIRSIYCIEKYKKHENSYYKKIDKEVKKAEIKYNDIQVMTDLPIPPEHLSNTLPDSYIFRDRNFEILLLPEIESVQEVIIDEKKPKTPIKSKIKDISIRYHDKNGPRSRWTTTPKQIQGRKARNNPHHGGRGR